MPSSLQQPKPFICSQCKQVKPHCAKGLCKKCYYQQRHAANKESDNAKSLAYYFANHEERKALARQWNENNKDKRRANELQRLYGLTPAAFDAMWVSQNGACAICQNPLQKRGNETNTDHDHITGIVRALLCRRCNLALGLVKDDTALLQEMVEYLSIHARKKAA